MIHTIAIQEILRRIINVDDEGKGLEYAIYKVTEAYRNEKIILDVGDLVLQSETGEFCDIFEVNCLDWEELIEL